MVLLACTACEKKIRTDVVWCRVAWRGTVGHGAVWSNMPDFLRSKCFCAVTYRYHTPTYNDDWVGIVRQCSMLPRCKEPDHCAAHERDAVLREEDIGNGGGWPGWEVCWMVGKACSNHTEPARLFNRNDPKEQLFLLLLLLLLLLMVAAGSRNH